MSWGKVNIAERGVMMEDTMMSPKMRILLIISRSSFSRVPSLCPTSTSSLISFSKKMLSSFLCGEITNEVMRSTTFRITHRMGKIPRANMSIGRATKSENFSLWDTAMVLGMTSPQTRIRGVMTAIAIHLPCSPHREMKSEAASTEAVMLTHSFPTRMEMSRRRGFSISS